MDKANEYLQELEAAEAAMGRMKDRLFAEFNPTDLEEAISRYYITHGRWPSYKQYWETLIMGVKQNLKKRGP